MLNGGGAVRGLHAEPRGKATGELLVSLTVRGRGTLLAYSSLKPQVGRRHQGQWPAFSKTIVLGACLPGLPPHNQQLWHNQQSLNHPAPCLPAMPHPRACRPARWMASRCSGSTWATG